MQSSNGSMSHLQGKTFFLLFETKDRDGKRTSAKVRGISNDANQGGKIERKMEQGATPTLFLPFHLDQDGRQTLPEVKYGCQKLYTYAYTHKELSVLFFHLLLNPLESIQNKKPIFSEENLNFLPYFNLFIVWHAKITAKRTKTQDFSQVDLNAIFWGGGQAFRNSLRLFRQEN